MKLNIMRASILSTIQENQPITVSALAEKVNISKGSSIYRYLKELEKRKLITMKKEKNKNKTKKGNPTYINTTNKAKPFSLQEIKQCKKNSDNQHIKYFLSLSFGVIFLLIFGINEKIMFFGFSIIFFMGAAFTFIEKRYWDLKIVILSK